MSKESSVCALGILILFVPFIGVPREYKEWILIVSGLLLIVIGYRLRRLAFFKSLENEHGERKGSTFAESDIAQKEILPPHRDSNSTP